MHILHTISEISFLGGTKIGQNEPWTTFPTHIFQIYDTTNHLENFKKFKNFMHILHTISEIANFGETKNGQNKPWTTFHIQIYHVYNIINNLENF